MIFKNIDGTTKDAFKIGLRGITLKVEDIERSIMEGDTETKQTFQHLKAMTADGKEHIVSFDDNNDLITISKKYCSKAEKVGDILTFYFRTYDSERKMWLDGEPVRIPINTAERTVLVKENQSVTIGHLASFDNEQGTIIADSGVAVNSSSNYLENCKDSDSLVPTVKAVIDYVGDISRILDRRLNGDKDYNKQ